VRLGLCAGLGLAILLALVFGLTGRTQSSGSNGGQGQVNNRSYSPRTDLSTLSTDNDLDPVMAERRMLALNSLRQKQMVADTDKLLKLTKELNEEVAAANTGSLTAEQLRKLADIEKLARNVRERMTNGVGQPPSVLPSPTPIMFPSH